MVTLEKFLRPEMPEGRSTELSEGKVMGWVPGEISSLDDPERLGRVRVRCDILQQDVDLPNSNDGWCWVLEDFIVNAASGGAHRLLKIGTQVAMLPMLGNPKQMLLLGCIPSRVDRPSPELNRAQEIYGTHTPGQVYDVNNDSDASWINTRPNGVVEHISGEGDRTMQTRDGGRLQIKADGTVQTQNPKGATTITPEGTITTQNTAGGVSTLDKNGEWEVKAATQAALTLKKSNAEMVGPGGKLPSLTKELKSQLGGTLDLGQQLLRQVEAIASGFGSGGDPESLLFALTPLIGQLQSILKDTIPQAAKTVSEFGNQAEGLVDHLTEQVDGFLDSGLSQVTKQINQALKDFPDINQALGHLSTILPPEFAQQLKPGELTPILTGLSHDLGMQGQTLLEAIAPTEFSNYQNLIGLDLHSNIGDITSLLGGLTGLDPTALNADTLITKAQSELTKLLPKGLQGFVGSPEVQQIIQLAITGGNPMSLLMGSAASGLIGDLAGELGFLSGSLPQVEAIAGFIANPTDLSKLTSVFNLGEIAPVDALTKALPDAIGGIGKTLGGLFGGGKKKFNKMFNGLGVSKKGGVVRALSDKVEAFADSSLLGAKLEVSKGKAALKGVGGAVEVFAGRKSAGINTPFGSFGFGEGGSNLFSQGSMAFKVLQDVGKVAGLILDKESGISISSFANSETKTPSAKINVDEEVITISSGNDDIQVSPAGVFLEGYRVKDYLDEFVAFKRSQEIRTDKIERFLEIGLFACTRNAIYEGVPEDDRLAIYVKASTENEAIQQMEALFPDETTSGFTVRRSLCL